VSKLDHIGEYVYAGIDVAHGCGMLLNPSSTRESQRKRERECSTNMHMAKLVAVLLVLIIQLLLSCIKLCLVFNSVSCETILLNDRACLLSARSISPLSPALLEAVRVRGTPCVKW
jgi:hypothetical protein